MSFGPTSEDLSLDAALARLSAWLAKDGQDMLETLRPGATDQELDALRVVIAPHDVPPELEAMWRWHNGQQGNPEATPRFLPLPEGNFLGTDEAIDAYRFLTEKAEPWQWCRLWIPLVHHRHSQSGVESVAEGPSVVVEADFGATDVTIVSSSLAGLLHGAADLYERGARHGGELRPEPLQAIRTRSDQIGWDNWKHPRTLPHDLEAADWPVHWRTANGFAP